MTCVKRKLRNSFIAIVGVSCLLTACATVGEANGAGDVSLKPASESLVFPKPKIKALRNKAPTHILFVGNSYLYYGDSVHNHVKRMVESSSALDAGGLTYKSATIGGAAIFDHDIDHLLSPANLRVDRRFDVVLLQGGSVAALSDRRRARFAQTVAEYSQKIENTGAETVLYMTPAYVPPHKRFRPGMIADIASLYVATGNENDALVIPVGLAFEEAYRRRPEIKLHKSFDGSHPSLIGTYLAAATVFASLYGVSPVGNTYDYFSAIDPETALFLQTVAHDTVENFYAGQ